MTHDKLRVAVLGAGKWAEFAHIQGWIRDPRAEVVVLADVEAERAEALAPGFAIPETTNDWQAAVSRSDVDVVDIVTPSHTHHELARAALASGKHVLCEKPVAYDFRETLEAATLAKKKSLKTKLGFTFRYSPAVQYAKRSSTTASSDAHISSTATSKTRNGSTRTSRSAKRRSNQTPRRSKPSRSRATAPPSSISDIGGSAAT